MTIVSVIHLATLGAEQFLSPAQGGPLGFHFVAAPPRGDLVRQGKHPLAILMPMHRHKAVKFEPLATALHRGGFAVLAANYRQLGGPYANAWQDMNRVKQWAISQPFVDAERIYLIGASIGSSVAIDLARRQPTGIQGLILMSPGLNYLKLAILPMLSTLKPIPILMTADASERAPVRTLRTVLKMRFKDVRRLVRAGIGHGTNQLIKSPTLSEQLLITLRTWTEKNCDRTRPQKRQTLNEGCKK